MEVSRKVSPDSDSEPQSWVIAETETEGQFPGSVAFISFQVAGHSFNPGRLFERRHLQTLGVRDGGILLWLGSPKCRKPVPCP